MGTKIQAQNNSDSDYIKAIYEYVLNLQHVIEM